VGYNVSGKPVAKPEGDENKLDTFISRSENPDWWRTIRDEDNQKDIVLSDKQLDTISRIIKGKAFTKKYDETDYKIELSQEDLKSFIHPFDACDPPKRRFQPSKWERVKINKIMNSIKKGY